MTEQEIADFRYHRTKELLERYFEIIQGYLPAMNGVTVGGRRELMAFNLLERLFYNAKAALFLYDEYGVSHNMAVPLSQLFRAIVYDVTISYWLFAEGQFDAHLLEFNADYINKNGRRIREMQGEDHVRTVTYEGWNQVAPENFTRSEAGLQPVQVRTQTFETISRELRDERPEPLFRELYLLYPLLSQQAHVSAFSKEIIYRRADPMIGVFYACCRGLLAGSAMLLTIVNQGDWRSVEQALLQLLATVTPTQPEQPE
ncbi:hypothetical protein [Hymenobacter cellulosivorans]|uniref:DUF2063 domain-containing protein n=1 Tax=Hymenobacter cellulosivorans TaxID=2932249 RepID=A0ABY4F1Z3_9BACT|nr:hypothetical protein [Hymenobacter cellulosivorans]UOQ50694.1 hypothetical protein MUN80_13085 [Hymenobacter cellulosivorans]